MGVVGNGTKEGQRTAPRTSAKALEQRQRDAMIVELRLSGATIEAIGKTPGIDLSYSAVRNAIERQLTRSAQEPSDQLREIEAKRLERMLLAIWKKVIAGDLASIDRALRISERKARLYGLDAARDVNWTMIIRHTIAEMGLSSDEGKELASDVNRWLAERAALGVSTD